MAKKKQSSLMVRFFSFLGSIVVGLLRLLWRGISWIFQKSKHANVMREGKEKDTSLYDELHQVKPLQGSLDVFTTSLYSSSSTVGIILGARGSGKSALGMRILENVRAKTSKKVVAMGFLERELPSWILAIDTPENIPQNSFVLVDEGGITFSSRSSMSNANKLLSSLLLVARHKDVSILFITQNSSNIEINTIRQADYLLMKPSSLLQLDFERKKIADIYRGAQKDFESLKETQGLTYIYSDTFRGFVSNTLPSFWSTRLSKSFRDKKNESLSP